MVTANFRVGRILKGSHYISCSVLIDVRTSVDNINTTPETKFTFNKPPNSKSESYTDFV